jgi:uncharacterized coiled-coil protein SlyX
MDQQLDPYRLSSRLTSLESFFTHLERQLAELSGVVLEQHRKIEHLEKQVRLLQSPPDEDDCEQRSAAIN